MCWRRYQGLFAVFTSPNLTCFKLRPLLSMSTEYSEGKSAHVVGSTRPLSEVLFSTSAEQCQIISDIDASKAIATQVWVLAAKVNE
jgi:hypothetical protein